MIRCRLAATAWCLLTLSCHPAGCIAPSDEVWDRRSFGQAPQPRGSRYPSSIFVSIAAFRDTELNPTVMDALAKADDPATVVMGIMVQDTMDAMLHDYEFERHPRFNGQVIRLGHELTRGTCWARSSIQTVLFGDEKYYMQLDSHHRFVQGWDTLLRDFLALAAKRSPKPLLSTYAPAYDPGTPPSSWVQSISRLSALKFYETGKLRIIPVGVDGWEELAEPQEQIALISGHLIFVDGGWVKEVPYDPDLYYEGEEDTLGIRSYTHGYDIFYPHRPVVWHYFTRPDAPRHDDNDLDRQSHEKFRRLVNTPGPSSDLQAFPLGYDFGKYGLGRARTPLQFARQSGIFWEKRHLHDKARNGDAAAEVDEAYVVQVTSMEAWAVTTDCGFGSKETCWLYGCRWVEGYPGPYCQPMDEPLKDCGFPGVEPDSCNELGCVWNPDGLPGPACQYGVAEYPPIFNADHDEV